MIFCNQIVKIGDFKSFGRVEITTNDKRRWSVSSKDLIDSLVGNFRIEVRPKGKCKSAAPRPPRRKNIKPKAKPKVKWNKFNITAEDT